MVGIKYQLRSRSKREDILAIPDSPEIEEEIEVRAPPPFPQRESFNDAST